jgi:hypothetical protein
VTAVDVRSWLDTNVAWIEAPSWLEVVAEATRTGWARAVVATLRVRFGEAPDALTTDLQRVPSREQADRLMSQAVRCPSLEAFVNSLHRELSDDPPSASTRGRRKPKPKE